VLPPLLRRLRPLALRLDLHPHGRRPRHHEGRASLRSPGIDLINLNFGRKLSGQILIMSFGQILIMSFGQILIMSFGQILIKAFRTNSYHEFRTKFHPKTTEVYLTVILDFKQGDQMSL
jgi:hypothetical protein